VLNAKLAPPKLLAIQISDNNHWFRLVPDDGVICKYSHSAFVDGTSIPKTTAAAIPRCVFDAGATHYWQ
jgi:hypothetical protein